VEKPAAKVLTLNILAVCGARWPLITGTKQHRTLCNKISTNH